MSDTSQSTVSVAFGVDQNGAQQQPYSTANETFGPGVEAPRAIQEQQARAAAAAAAAAQQQHPQQTQAQLFTQEQVEAARSAERDKLYTELTEVKASLTSIQAERDAAAAEQAAEVERLAAEAKAAEEEKMGAKAYAETRTNELQAQLDNLRGEQAQREALFAKEREFMALQEHRAARLGQEDAQQIIPQFRDLVAGNTTEEIEQSVQDLIARSAAVVQEIQQVQQQRFIQQPGVSTRAPGALSSPTEMADSTRQLGKQDIDAMDMATYARLRPQLLQQRPQGF